MPKLVTKNPVFEKRTIQVQSTLDNHSAFLTLNVADIYYLTACTGSNNHVLVCAEKIYLFTDGRYLTQIDTQKQVDLIIEEIGVSRSFEQALNEVLTKEQIATLKFNAEGMSYTAGKSMVSALPTNAVSMQENSLFPFRTKKDEMEIEIIKQNLLITQAAFLYIQSILKAGKSELEVAAELEYYCKKQGATSMAFGTIVASGERSALPHGAASTKIINDGDMVQFDFGIIKNHYCSDFSRVLTVGEVDPKLLEIREIIKDAVLLVENNARCGMTGKEIDAIARDYITSKGYGEYFGHGLGHAMGIDVHENPRLNTVWDKPITENMVLTIEPGIYLPGLGGVRLEDVAVMRSDKFEVLTNCAYEF